MRNWREWSETHGPAFVAAAAVAALCVYAFVVRYGFLLQSPYPWGVDSYYYPVQLREILRTGHLNYPTAPLVFYLMAPLGWFTDPIHAAKMGAAAGTALMAVPVYLLGKRLSGSRGAAVAGAALAATSLQSFYLATEFVKEGVGLTIGALAVVAVFAARERPTRARIGLAAAAVVAAFLAHKTAFGLTVLLAGPPVAVTLWRAERHRRLIVGVTLGAIVAVIGLSLLAPERFLGVHDVSLLTGAIQGQADLSFPTLVRPKFALYFGHEVAIAAGLGVLAITAHVGFSAMKKPGLPLEAVGFIGVALLVGIPYLAVTDIQGLGFRVRLMSYVVMGPLGALLLARGFALLDLPHYGRELVALGAAVGIVIAKPATLDEGLLRTHPALVASVRAMEGVLPPDVTLVTQDRKIAFMVRWYVGQATRLHPAGTDPATTYRLMPGGLMQKDLADALDELRIARPPGVVLPRDLHPNSPNGMVLIPEATFQYLLTRITDEGRAYYAAWPTT